MNDWDWPHASNVQLSIRGPSAAAATWKGDGTLQLQRGRFRTIGFNSASASVDFRDGAVTYENFRSGRDEGVATGTFVYDFAHHETRLSNVVSGLRPTEAIYWIDPKLLKVVTPYKFQKSSYDYYQRCLSVSRRQKYAPRNQCRVIGWDGLYFSWENSAVRPHQREVAPDRLSAAISELNGAIFSGTVRGSADLSLAKNDQRYRAAMTVDHVDFPKLTDLYFKYKTAVGLMNGRYEWTGIGSDARTMNGKGEVEVRNGDVFAIPLFGPLSDILNKIMPGIGYRVARKGKCRFTIKDGVIRTSDFHVDGGTFGMVGEGNAHFLDDKIDFDVRIDASGAGAVLTPLYKFFEYKAEGSLKKPDWHPKIF